MGKSGGDGLRFVLDQDVDVAVGRMLRQRGHDAWTAANAGFSTAGDDDLTVYADDQGAALLTHDKEFSKRRRRNVVGQHIWLDCKEWDGAQLLALHLDDVVGLLRPGADVFIAISHERLELSWAWD